MTRYISYFLFLLSLSPFSFFPFFLPPPSFPSSLPSSSYCVMPLKHIDASWSNIIAFVFPGTVRDKQLTSCIPSCAHSWREISAKTLYSWKFISNWSYPCYIREPLKMFVFSYYSSCFRLVSRNTFLLLWFILVFSKFCWCKDSSAFLFLKSNGQTGFSFISQN